MITFLKMWANFNPWSSTNWLVWDASEKLSEMFLIIDCKTIDLNIMSGIKTYISNFVFTNPDHSIQLIGKINIVIWEKGGKTIKGKNSKCDWLESNELHDTCQIVATFFLFIYLFLPSHHLSYLNFISRFSCTGNWIKIIFLIHPLLLSGITCI